MDARAFWRAVEADPDLEILRCVEGATPQADFVDVKHWPTHGGTRLPMSEILRLPAEELMDLLKYRRPPRIMLPLCAPPEHYGELPAISADFTPVAIAS